MKGVLRALKLFLISIVIGAFVALIVCLYKFCAHHIIHLSQSAYLKIRENLWLVPLVLIALFGISILMCKAYARFENLKGGGIPNAVLASRGKGRLSPIVDSVGTFAASLLTFLLGVPLGNEGPCVQMGAAVSSGVSKAFLRDEEENKAIISSGACAGFAAAVGGGLCGTLFCLDEIDRRPKLSALLCSAASSVTCAVLMRLICPLLNVSAAIFPAQTLPEFSIKDIWIAFLVGAVFAVFSIAFLKFYKLLRGLFVNSLCKVPLQLKIFLSLALCLFAGLISFSFISTGHDFACGLFVAAAPITLLLAAVLVRSVLTLSANANGICGGTFIPLLAIATALGSIIFALCSSFLGGEYYSLVLMLSLAACVSSMMKMPLVSVAFAFETFLCPQYLPFIIVASGVSYLASALLKVESINEIIIESKK